MTSGAIGVVPKCGLGKHLPLVLGLDQGSKGSLGPTSYDPKHAKALLYDPPSA